MMPVRLQGSESFHIAWAASRASRVSTTDITLKDSQLYTHIGTSFIEQPSGVAEMRPLMSCREISCAVTSVAVARELGSWGVGELRS